MSDKQKCIYNKLNNLCVHSLCGYNSKLCPVTEHPDTCTFYEPTTSSSIIMLLYELQKSILKGHKYSYKELEELFNEYNQSTNI